MKKTALTTLAAAVAVGCSSADTAGGGAGGDDSAQHSATSGAGGTSVSAGSGGAPASGGGGTGTVGGGGAGGAGCDPAADHQSDPLNCGACGHDCLGGACLDGVCQRVTLHTGKLGYGLAIDDIYVYFREFNQPPNPCGSTVTLDRLHKNGGTAEILDSAAAGLGEEITTRNGYVYYFAYENPLDPYCTSNWLVHRRIATGGTAIEELLAAPPFDESVSQYSAVGVSDFFYLDGADYGLHTVNSIPLGGGTPVIVAQVDYGTEDYSWLDLVTDDVNLYWASYPGGGEWSVLQAPVAGGTPTTLVAAADVGASVWPVAADGSSVFYGAHDESAAASALYSLALGATGPGTLVYQAASGIGMVRLSGSDVCFLEYGAFNVTCIPKSGGTARVLATANTVHGLAADDTAVYWIENVNYPPDDEFAIYKLAK